MQRIFRHHDQVNISTVYFCLLKSSVYNQIKSNMNKRQELEQKLIEKAMKDELFKHQLLKDPKGAIEAEFGVKIPDTLNINILEEGPKTFYLVIPHIPSLGAAEELTEAELESVAGGTLFTEQEWSCACFL